MFLNSLIELSSIDPKILWVNIAILAGIILIGVISARRFNFFHGFIVVFTLIFTLGGINNILPNVNLANIQESYELYTGLVIWLPDFVVSQILSPIQNNIGQAQEWMIYFAPIVLWLLSSIFAHIFRRKRY